MSETVIPSTSKQDSPHAGHGEIVDAIKHVDNRSKKASILVVDPDVAICEFIKKNLEKSYIIHIATSGKEALEKIQDRVDLVLCNAIIPETNGSRFLKTIKENTNIPVILIADRTAAESETEEDDIGAEDYLFKPFTPKELMARVKCHIRISKTRSHLERQLNNLFIQAPIAICIFRGPSYIVEIANEKMLELWGKKPDEVLHKPLFTARPDVVGQGLEELLKNVYVTGERYVAREHALNLVRNGKAEKIYVKFVYEALRDEDGSISGIMALGDDITEQVHARKKIEESRKQIRNLILQAPVAMAIFQGPSFVIEVANQKALELWERTADQVINKPLSEALPNPGEHGLEESLRRVYSSGESFFNPEYRVSFSPEITSDDSYLSFALEPLQDFDGNISAVMAVAINITEQVNARKKIEESEERLRLAIGSAKLGTWDFNPLNDNLILSGRCKKIYGLPAGEEINFKNFIDHVHPYDKDHVLLKTKIAMDPASGGNYDTTYRIVSFNDNSLRWVKASGKVSFDREGKPVRFIGTVLDITEEKKQAEEIARLAAIVQSSGDAIVSKTLDGIITSWNDSAQRIFGYDASEMIGESITKIIPAERKDEEPRIIAGIKKGQVFDHFETQRLTKDNRLIDISLTISPIKDLSGNITGASKIARDITAQKEAERLINESEQRLKIALESAEMGTWEVNYKTGEFIFSKRHLEIFGYDESYKPTREELMKQLHPGDIAIRERTMKEAFETGVLHAEMRILVGEDKRVRWIRSTGKVFYDEKHEPVKMMGISMDITEQKKFFETLRESEERYRFMADFMPQKVWRAKANGNIDYLNKPWMEYTHLPFEELMEWGWTKIVHVDDTDITQSKWQHSIETGENFELEHRFLCHDGTYRWHLSRGIAQKDTEGNILMWVGSNTDINDIKESEQQKDFFISMASHELKTPITSIKGYVQILLSMYTDSKDNFLKNSLGTIEKQIGTLTNLITDLLDISKIKTGSLQLEKSVFQVNELVTEIIDEVSHTDPDCYVTFYPGEEHSVAADRDRIGQVLINLLTNAIKYSPDSNVINIRTFTKDNMVVVSVQDFGIGIGKEDQKKIFERFYRVEGKNANTYPGFGIGLFIASEIIKRHDGEIYVQSEPDRGSVFYFALPLSNYLTKN